MDVEAAPTRCITCSDEGIPMRVVRLADDDAAGLARCIDEAGAEHSVAVDLIESVALGDDILVHAGVAIAQTGRCAV